VVTAEILKDCHNHDAIFRPDPDFSNHLLSPCVYLGEETKTLTTDAPPELTYKCQLHGHCTLKKTKDPLAECTNCKDKLLYTSQDLSGFQDTLRIVDRSKKETPSLRNTLAGRPAFLVCGGPSTKELDLSLLQRRGIWSLGVNNVAGSARTNAFVCSDPPSKFSHSIWLDPSVMKFVPTPKLTHKPRGTLRRKVDNNTFIKLKQKTVDAPNVWGFDRRSWLMPDSTFFTEPSAAWGNHNDGVERTGMKKDVNTMYLGIRLLYYLGARTIFLLGADFFMDPKATLFDNYGFPQARDKNAINSNNQKFQISKNVLGKLKPVFEKFGLSVYNCNQHSHLRAFDYVPYKRAIEVSAGIVEESPSLSGWYEK